MIPVPVQHPLVALAVVLGATTAAVGVVTVAFAWRTHRQRRRNDAIRDRLQGDLFDRLFEAEPDWAGWVETLSEAERTQVLVLLERYLRQLRGTEHQRLRGLAAALDVIDDARAGLEGRRGRFRALTWLALLEESVEPDVLRATCGTNRRHRDAAARVLYASGHADAAVAGTELLLGDGDEPLSAFGMDTLYRLNDGPRTPLLALASERARSWNERLLVQVLIVLRHCSVAETDDNLDWLLTLLAHDSARVRSATLGVIERHGWRPTFRQRIDVEALLSDPDAAVRHDAYLLLASWPDPDATAWLTQSLDVESDRELLAVVRALSMHREASLPTEGRAGPFADWVRADAAVGARRRIWGVTAAWT